METLFRLAICLGLIIGLSIFSEDLAFNRTSEGPAVATTPLRESCSSVPAASCVALLSREDVRIELAIEDAQKQLIDECLANYRAELSTRFNDVAARGMTQKQFESVLNHERAFQKLGLTELEKQLIEILTNQQWTRLQQLQRQREGMHAFRRPEVIAALNLTNDQFERIRDLPVVGFCLCAPDEQRVIVRVAISTILTESQSITWKNLRGEEFAFGPLD